MDCFPFSLISQTGCFEWVIKYVHKEDAAGNSLEFLEGIYWDKG